MEEALSELATMWYARMQQFWKDDRIVRMADINGKVTTGFLSKQDLTADFDIMITSGSTMPLNRNAMLDLMIRLSQTQAEDGLPMVDREAIMEFVPIGNKQQILERFEERAEGALQEEADAMEQQLGQMTEMLEALTKEVEGLKQIHEQDVSTQKNKELIQKGYDKGQSQKGLTDDEISGIIEGESKIPDDTLNEIEALNDEEMQQLLTQFPELDKIIANNS